MSEEVTDNLGNTDLEVLDFCGLPEVLHLELGQSKRPSHAMWFLVSDLPNILHSALRQAITDACTYWPVVANVTMSESPTKQQADLLIDCSRIDGPQGILAQCELPGPKPQHMTVDTNEQWVIHLGPSVPNMKIDLVRVIAHELGHFWGLEHAPRNSPNLMAPSYNPRIDHPQSDWDIPQMQARYGHPIPTPDPIDPTTGSVIKIIITNAEKIEIPGYKIQKV
jgi:hypothetical protein